jgi:hypothetical protein
MFYSLLARRAERAERNERRRKPASARQGAPR